MAFPVILVDSVNGSASPNASGAGPSTAVTGSSAAHTGGVSSTTITFTNSPNLSGVNNDGSHAIYLVTASGRRFSKITGVDNVAKTVTTEDAFNIASGSAVSYAIGGKLASLWGTGYVRLVDDGSSSGDAKGGWTIEFQNAHAETQSSTEFRASGDTTNGLLTVRGISSASTRPVITTSYLWGLMLRSNYALFKDFDIKQTAASTYVVRAFAGSAYELKGLRLYSTASPKASYGVQASNGMLIADCVIYDCDVGVLANSECFVENCYIRDCVTTGVDLSGTVPGSVEGCIFVDCPTGIAHSSSRKSHIVGNVFDTCTTGIKFSSAPSNGQGPVMCQNNVMVNCTTGLHVNVSGQTQKSIEAAWWSYFKNNAFWNNTTHYKVDSTSVTATTLDGFVITSSEPFTTATKASRKTAGAWVGTTELKAVGFPTVGPLDATASRSYVDIGLQRQEPDFIAPSGLIARNIGTY